MFGNLKNLAGLMSQMGDLREKAEAMQRELEKKTVEGDAGAGAVRVRMNGKNEVLGVELDQNMIAALAASPGASGGTDKKVIEELIAAAFNDAQAKVRGLLQEEVQKATGGMNLPGIEKLFGGGG
jgi:DNA-binding YbaB/EbfC family protein